MGQKNVIASLEIELAMATAGAIQDVVEFGGVMSKTMADSIRSANQVDDALKKVGDMSAATARVATFKDEVSRTAAEAKKAFNRIERAGESMAAQLDRQISVFGKTTSEIRSMKAEAAAAAAESEKQSELAARIRAKEQTLYDMEYAAMNRAKNEAKALAEDRAAAAVQAEQAAEREAKAVREAAFAHQMFEARVRAGATALREEAAVKADKAAERNAIAVRDAAIAHQFFEARVREGAAAMRSDADALQRLRDMLDPATAAQNRLNHQVDEARRIMIAAGHSEEDVARAVALLTKTQDEHSNSLGLNRMQFVIGASAVHRFVDSIAAGQSPMRSFMMQAGDIVTVLQSDDGGMAGGLAKVRGLINPVTVGIAAITAVVAVGTLAWLNYSSALDQFNALSQGSGRLIGMTGSQIEASAESAARVANITISSARDIEAGYVQTGKIGGDVITRLTALTTDFAAGTGQDAKGAIQQLGAAFTDPIAGAQQLAERFGLVDQATADYIGKLVEQNDLTGAQRVLLNTLEPAFDGAAEHANTLARGWHNIKYWADEAFTAMGRALASDATADKIKALEAQRDNPAIKDYITHADPRAFYQKQIDDLRYQDSQARAAADRDKNNSDVATGLNIANQFNGDNRDEYRAKAGALRAALSQGRPADETAQLTATLDAYTHAIDTFIPKQEKANQLADIDARIAAAKNPAAKAALTVEKALIEQKGALITTADAEAVAHAKGAAALATASRAGDNHAETLRKEAEAQEAQISNLYALGDAYGISGAKALIAEARVKAESDAIKKGGDVAEAVDRQVRIAIAQRVSDANKSTAAMRDQTAAQERVNAQVAAGLVPSAKAAQLVRDQMADLPLLAAIQAAQQQKLTAEVEKATKALADQRKARQDLTEAEAKGRFLADMAGGKDQLAILGEELRLIGATEAARVHALATLKATQEATAKLFNPEQAANYIQQQVQIADSANLLATGQNAYNELLDETVNRWSAIEDASRSAADGISSAFGKVGGAIGDVLVSLTSYGSQQARLALEEQERLKKVAGAETKQVAAQAAIKREYAIRTAAVQVSAYADMAGAAQGFFKEGSAGYKALGDAEKVFRAIQFALSLKAIATDAIETGTKIANSAARTAAGAVEAVVNAIKSLPFPFNLAAGAATIAALAAIGVSIAGSFGGGGKSDIPKANDGTGTVLGDATAKSESIKNAIDRLKDVDDVTLVVSRDMLTSLRAIENSIGGFASLIVRAGNVNASAGVEPGFKTSGIGSALGTAGGLFKDIPVLGAISGAISSVVKSLFGTKTTIVGSGLFGGPQSLEDIHSGGFDAQYYSDIKKKKKTFGITTSTKYSTNYDDADPALSNQFTLILDSFDKAILAAAGPLNIATDTIADRLNGFVVDIGKIDLQGLTGAEIQEKLSAVFGAAADNMAEAAIPGLDRFQEVGEGAFETLIRVASTVEAVDATFQKLGRMSGSLGIDIDMAIAGMFDSVSDFTSAADEYFQTYYSSAEQAAAKTAQIAKVFDHLNLGMPDTLAGFRSLVEAQDLTTAAGQQTYATLLELAPAFADLKKAMDGAKSAADILSERQNLERQILQLQGDTAAIRAAELAKLDVSNRALQEQIYAIQDAKDAADAARQLRDAWTSVGDSIMDEVKRIRGLTDVGTGGGFASLLGQFNASSSAARLGDQDAAKSLPQLSKSLLDAAAKAATSRQELDRIQAQTAASLEATYAAIADIAGNAAPSATSGTTDARAALSASPSATSTAAANDDLVSEVRAMAAELRAQREEIAKLRSENNAGNASIANNTSSIKRTLDNVTQVSGGDAISVAAA